MEEYPVGTIEYFIVDVTDHLGHLTSLDGYPLSFYCRADPPEFSGDPPTVVWKYEDENATNDNMKILCLLDTTDWDVGEYLLWAVIEAAPESPKLGPFRFRMV